MLVMGHVLTWWGVPMRIASVFELLSCRKFKLIHALISSRQVVRVDDGDGVGWSMGVVRVVVVAGLRGGGFILR